METLPTLGFWWISFDIRCCSGCGPERSELTALEVGRDGFLYCARHKVWCRNGDAHGIQSEEHWAANRKRLDEATEVRMYGAASDDLPPHIKEQMKTFLFDKQVRQILNAREHGRKIRDIMAFEEAQEEEHRARAQAAPPVGTLGGNVEEGQGKSA